MKKLILVIDQMHESLEEKFLKTGYKIDYRPEISKEEAKQLLGSGMYVGLILRSKLKIDAGIIQYLKGIKFIGRAGAGIDNLDVKAVKEKGIKILNAPEGNRDAVAEHTMGTLLSILHKIRISDIQVRSNIWDREGNRGIELKGRTVGILGYGNMGSALAERLHGFGCRVIAYDIYRVGFENTLVKEVDFDTFCQQTEILSIHIPLTSKNAQLINYEYLDHFEKLKIILNTSRGEVLILKDLLRMLREGRILGAGLDVLENEKLHTMSSEQKMIFEGLKKFDSVIFTPHVAGWTHESYEKINQVLADKVSKLDIDIG